MEEIKLTKTDVSNIKGFIEHVNEMSETSFIKRCLIDKKISTKFSWDITTGAQIKTNAPDREELANFLTYFRQVYSNDDRFNAKRLCNIVLRYKLLAEPYHSNIDNLKNDINLVLKTKPEIQINIKGDLIAVKNKDILDLFINGRIFHSDEKSYETLAYVKKLEIYPFLWQLFISVLISLANTMFRIKNNLEKIDFEKLENI